jgi:hypothetical protein
VLVRILLELVVHARLFLISCEYCKQTVDECISQGELNFCYFFGVFFWKIFDISMCFSHIFWLLNVFFHGFLITRNYLSANLLVSRCFFRKFSFLSPNLSQFVGSFKFLHKFSLWLAKLIFSTIFFSLKN